MSLLLVPGPVRSLGRTARVRLAGLALIGICAALLGLAVLVYQKAFTPVVRVTLRASSIGNQLVVPADVKLRGIVVGEVRSVRSDGRQATLELALDPGDVHLVPANVRARILPKTLFGEKFVDLVLPPDPSPRHIAAGDVITQDRSSTAIELQRVFDDVLPLLRTLKPAQLNETLSAIADALQDRGRQLGGNLVLADDYFAKLDQHLPAIEADISGLADLAANVNDAAPDLLALARNASVTWRTVDEKRQALAQLISSAQAFSTTTTRFLQDNANRLITLASVSRPTLAVLATYSPELPCFTKGLTDLEQRIEPVFGPGPYLHIVLQAVPSRGGYVPGKDWPSYRGYGPPSCHGLPSPGSPPPAHGAALPDVPGDLGPVGSAAEQHLVTALVAPVLGAPGAGGSTSPGLADLLMGPMLRGTAVTQR
ncbi:MAG: MCE family protein [Frankiaceae bacterium]